MGVSMDAIINLSHFIGHQGKQKAKFTEMTNIFDSRSPIHDILKNGQGHGLILSNKQIFLQGKGEEIILLLPLWYVFSSRSWILNLQIEVSAQAHLQKEVFCM